MLDPEIREALANRLKIVLIVYLALFGSLGFYVLAAFVIGGEEVQGPEGLQTLTLALGIAAVVVMLASFFVRAAMLRAGLARLPRHIDESQLDALTRATFTPWAVSWMLCEAVALCGLLLFALTHRWMLLLPFVGLAAVGMILHAPGLRAIEDALARR